MERTNLFARALFYREANFRNRYCRELTVHLSRKQIFGMFLKFTKN